MNESTKVQEPITTIVALDSPIHILLEKQPPELALDCTTTVRISITDDDGIVLHQIVVAGVEVYTTPIGKLLDEIRGILPATSTFSSLAATEARLAPFNTPEAHAHRTHELFYNVMYARQHNPKLMLLGFTGGFGCQRAAMLKAVKGGDMVRAEKLFWELVKQTIIETYNEWVIPEGRSLQGYMDEWFDRVIDNPTDPQWAEIRHFIRPASCGDASRWQVMVREFLESKGG